MILPLISSLTVTGYAATSGYCGENVAWSLSGDGVLTIEGSGAMASYTSSAQVPWYGERARIVSAFVSEGVISVSNYAFYNCNNLLAVSLPDTLEAIGTSAFSGCVKLEYNELSGAKYLGNASNPYVILISADDAFATDFSVPSGTRIISDWVFGDYIKLKNVDLPEGLVTIGKGAFSNCSKLASVTFPSTLKYVGSSAFGGCKALTEIALPSGVTSIGNNAFYNCTSLEIFSLPAGTTAIERKLFNGCKALAKLIIHSGVTSIGDGVLDGCTSLKDVYYGGTEAAWNSIERADDFDEALSAATLHINSTCGDNIFFSIDSSGRMRVIGNGDMYDYSPAAAAAPWYGLRDVITSIVISHGIASVGDGTFADLSSITKITIPNSVNEIGDGAFTGCTSLSTVDFIGTLSEWESIAVGSGNDALRNADVRFVDSGKCGENLTWTYDFEENSLTIEGFGEMTDFSTSNIPWSVYKSSALTLVIEDGATSVCDYAFSGFKALTSAVVPDSINHVGSSAFDNCTSLEYTISGRASYIGNPSNPYLILVKLDEMASSCTINPGTKIIGSSAFCDCTRIRTLTIPDGVVEIGHSAFANCNKLASINIPKNVLSLNGQIFSSCNSITSMTVDPENTKYHSSGNCIIETATGTLVAGCVSSVIPTDGSVTLIGAYAFYGRKTINTITIPDCITSIGDNAFGYCQALTGLIIPDSVTYIGEGAFQNCTQISVISIPEGIRAISKNTFKYCTSLSEIYLPASLKSIGNSAFISCTALKTVYFAGTQTEFSKVSIDNANGENFKFLNATIYFGFAKGGQCGDALTWKIDTASGILTVEGYGAMYDYANGAPWSGFAGIIKSISLPYGITYIGENAFSDCTSLTDVYYGGNENNFAGVTVSSGNEPLSSALFHIAASGTCGDAVSWELDISSGTLTISGDGAMYDFDKAPWYNSKDSITTVVILSGVASIGENAFADCAELKTALIANTVLHIGSDAFKNCVSLVDVYFEGLAVEWSEIGAEIPQITTVHYNSICGDGVFWEFDGVDTLTLEGRGATYDFDADAPWSNIAQSIKKARISDGIVSIGEGAFLECTALSNVYYGGDSYEWSEVEIKNGNAPLTSARIHYTYTVTYDAAGGDGAPLPQKKAEGSALVISSDVPTKAYKVTLFPSGGTLVESAKIINGTFESWNTKSNGKGTTYTPGSTYTADASVTLYAVWKDPACGALPAPTHEIYEFVGWYTEPVGGTEVTPDTVIKSDMTLYARWAYYLDLTEIYSFANSRANFGATYTVSDEDFQKLCDYVKLIYKDNEKTAANVINNLQQSRAAEWGGSCYGMALSAILDKSGQIGFNENFDSDAATLSEVSPPNENAAVESAINYYHISQRIPYLRGNLVTTYRKGASNWREGLESLVAAAQRGNPLLFCYSHSNYGHAIVIKGYTKGADGSHNLVAYDNRRPNIDTVVKIDKNFYSCTVGNTEDCLTFDFVEDMTPFDAIDIDGPENDYANFTLGGSSSGGGGNNKDLAEITIKSAGRVTVTNAEGETLIFDGGEYHGTMDVTSDYLDIGDGEGEDFTFTYTVNNSSSFTFTPEDEKLYVSVLSSDVYASAETDSATYSVISRDDGVSAFGTSFEYLLTLSVNDGVCDMVSVNGTTSETVNLSNNDVIKASGVDTQNGRVKIYSDTVNVDTYRYASGYSSFIIEELSDNPGDIRIMGSSNDDGVYDVNIGTIYVECQHEWDDGVVTTPASYNDDGVMTYTCRLCGETRTEVIPKLDPMPGDVHGDGVINAKDVAAIKEVLVGRYNAPNIAYINCDIDGDDAVTAHDLAALKEMLVR